MGIMGIVTKFCLGTLSDIYYKAQLHMLKPQDLFAGLVCRGLIGNFMYNNMVNSQRFCEGESYHDSAGIENNSNVSGSAVALKTSQSIKAFSSQATGGIHWATLRTHMHDLFRNQPGLG